MEAFKVFKIKVYVVLFAVLFLLSPCLFATEQKSYNAIGFDLYGVSYNQYSLSYERLLFQHLSLGIAFGYSPQGLFNFYGSESNYSSYFLFQLDAKSYLFSNQLKDLYIGCGTQLDIAPNPLILKYGNSSGNSSAILAMYGELGWKFIFKGNAGFFIDPCILFYTATPVGILVNAESDSMIWGYKLWAPMMTVTFGYMF
jgi:hypothetical protein